MFGELAAAAFSETDVGAPVGGVDTAFSISLSFSISFSRTLIYTGVAASNFYE